MLMHGVLTLKDLMFVSAIVGILEMALSVLVSLFVNFFSEGQYMKSQNPNIFFVDWISLKQACFLVKLEARLLPQAYNMSSFAVLLKQLVPRNRWAIRVSMRRTLAG